jgi:cytochrome c biogenesis factor
MNYFAKIYKRVGEGGKSMKNLLRTLVFAIIFVFSATISYSQQVKVSTDSTGTVQKKTDTEQGVQNQNMKQNRNQGEVKGQGNGQNAENAKSVKKVNSAKPDWSKAKGARPNIVRPSGSGVPQGAGKPGGAGKFRGGR